MSWYNRWQLLNTSSSVPTSTAPTPPTPPTPPSLPSFVRLFVDWGALPGNDGKFAPDLANAGTPSSNMICFPTGPIMNESGSTSPAKTNNTTLVTSPDGVKNLATRILTSGSNSDFYFHRASSCPVPPSGPQALRFRMRAAPGTGPWNFTAGLSTSLVSDIAEDLDWTNSANDAATTFECEFTYAGTGDVKLRLPTLGSDVIIDRIQWYAGTLADIPDWDDEVLLGGRRGFSFEGSMPLDSQGAFDTTSLSSGAWILEPGLEYHTYATGAAIFHYGSYEGPAPVASTANFVCAPLDAAAGTAQTRLALGIDYPTALGVPAAGYGTLYQRANGATGNRNFTRYHPTDQGMFMSGISASSTNGNKFWISDVCWYRESTSLWTSKQFNRWTVGAYTTTQRADLQAAQAKGKYAFTAIMDREPTQAEVTELREYFEYYATDRGYTVAVMDDMHVFSGDSNGTIGGATDWVSLMGGDGAFDDQPNLVLMSTSIGGQGVDELEGVSGRYALKDSVFLEAITDSGRRAFYHIPIGENDFTAIAASASAWVDRYTAIAEAGEAISVGNVWPVGYGPLPRPDGGASYETNRLLAGEAIRDWTEESAVRAYVEFGTSDTIGNRQLQIDGAGAPYYQGDETHFNEAGDAEAFAQAQPVTYAQRAL